MPSRERKREKESQQRLSGARNNDGSNVTSNKFNEITYNFPNEHKKNDYPNCATLDRMRDSFLIDFLFVRKKSRKDVLWIFNVKNTTVFDSNYDCCVFSYQIIWLRRRFGNIITHVIFRVTNSEQKQKQKPNLFSSLW